MVSLSFTGVNGEALSNLLDLKGIAVSTGSACSSGSREPSHVLMAMGLGPEQAQSTVRFSFATDNTREQIDYVVETLKTSVAFLRGMSPVKVQKRK